MDFVTGVNRLLRTNGIIKGDDDNITTFSDTQHSADIELAQIAIQNELAELVSDRLIPYEKTTANITLTTGTRSYGLAADFIRFFGSNPSFYDSTDNVRYYMYPGGEDALKDHDYQYKTTQGGIIAWYPEATTTKQVSFYNVPNSTYNSRSISYDYEKDVSVTNTSDTLPFHTTTEANTFVELAARRFFFMLSNQPTGDLMEDTTYRNAKSRLYNLMRMTNPSMFYGYTYL